MKLVAINSVDSLFFEGWIRKDSSTYLKTPRLGLSGLYILGIEYIVSKLEQLEDDLDLVKAKKIFKEK
ncbi:Uncharacterised protein [Bacillus freudenreichii]|nr:Uncharacterised protein [Bacillus freudenreichii]